jgi:hypothetical protein
MPTPPATAEAHESSEPSWQPAEAPVYNGAVAEYEAASPAPIADDTVAPAAAEPEKVPEPISEPVFPTAEAEQGIPFTSEPERVLEEAAAAPVPAMAEAEAEAEPEAQAAAPEPAARLNDDVLTVTEKPANPRKGWWQRLINS